MRGVYVVPGTLGSELYRIGPFGNHDLLWVDYTLLALGMFKQLKLAPNGTDPDEDEGKEIVPGNPLPDYYGDCISRLRSDLEGQFRVEGFGYDWRLSLFTNGTKLARRITFGATPEEPCTIVAHSMGGLIARWAWLTLAQSGEQNLVSRIITLGTPHFGSYSTIRVFSGEDESAGQLSRTYSTPRLGAVPPLEIRLGTPMGRVIEVACTWPSFYDVMPFLFGPDAALDPLRLLVYQGREWSHDVPISLNHLATAKDVTQAGFRLPGSMPPANVMMCLAARGYRPPGKSTGRVKYGDPAAYAPLGNGDEHVTLASAMPEGYYSETFRVNHADMPNVLALSGDLTRLITLPSIPAPAVHEGFLSHFLPYISVADPPFPESKQGMQWGGEPMLRTKDP